MAEKQPQGISDRNSSSEQPWSPPLSAMVPTVTAQFPLPHSVHLLKRNSSAFRSCHLGSPLPPKAKYETAWGRSLRPLQLLKSPASLGRSAGHSCPPHQPPAPLCPALLGTFSSLLIPVSIAFSSWPLMGPPRRPFLPNPSASSEKVSQLTACSSSGMEAFRPWEVA